MSGGLDVKVLGVDSELGSLVLLTGELLTEFSADVLGDRTRLGLVVLSESVDLGEVLVVENLEGVLSGSLSSERSERSLDDLILELLGGVVKGIADVRLGRVGNVLSVGRGGLLLDAVEVLKAISEEVGSLLLELAVVGSLETAKKRVVVVDEITGILGDGGVGLVSLDVSADGTGELVEHAFGLSLDLLGFSIKSLTDRVTHEDVSSRHETTKAESNKDFFVQDQPLLGDSSGETESNKREDSVLADDVGLSDGTGIGAQAVGVSSVALGEFLLGLGNAVLILAKDGGDRDGANLVEATE